jgi:hypothetical protein
MSTRNVIPRFNQKAVPWTPVLSYSVGDLFVMATQFPVSMIEACNVVTCKRAPGDADKVTAWNSKGGNRGKKIQCR